MYIIFLEVAVDQFCMVYLVELACAIVCLNNKSYAYEIYETKKPQTEMPNTSEYMHAIHTRHLKC